MDRHPLGTLMKESDVVKSIMRYLDSLPECFSHKEHGGMYGTAGLPDIICCYQGHYVAFEVKTPVGKLTRLQEATLRRITAAKGVAHKVTSVDEVKDIIMSLRSEVKDK